MSLFCTKKGEKGKRGKVEKGKRGKGEKGEREKVKTKKAKEMPPFRRLFHFSPFSLFHFSPFSLFPFFNDKICFLNL